MSDVAPPGAVSRATRVHRRGWSRSGSRGRRREVSPQAPRSRSVGEGLRIWAAGHLEKGREVTASGPYRLSRHPLYVGSTLIALGFAVASARVAAAVLVVVYLTLTYAAAIRSEEAHLTEKFGEAYPEYREGRSTGVDRRFSVRRVVRNREYRAVAGLVLVLALLAWKAL